MKCAQLVRLEVVNHCEAPEDPCWFPMRTQSCCWYDHSFIKNRLKTGGGGCWSQLIISLSFKWDAFPRSHLIPPPPFNGINASSAVCQQNRLLTFSEAVPQTSSESDTESLRFEDLQVIQSFHLKFIWVSFFCWENTAQIHSKLITWMVWTTQTLWGPIGGFSKANFSSPFEFYGRYKVYSHIWSFTVTLFLSSDPNL